ncbi:MAG: hypothetical protein JW728_07450 [Candidatus Aureabacteria bacterium]|nr:hypothetical protein [Candidatus Auribacterota bacterium]
MRKFAVPLLFLLLACSVLYIFILFFRTDSVLGIRIGKSKGAVQREFERLAIKKLDEGDGYIVYEKMPGDIKHVKNVKMSFSPDNKLTKFEVWFAKRAKEIVNEGVDDEIFYKKQGDSSADFDLYFYVRDELSKIHGEPHIESISMEKGWAACKWYLKKTNVIFGVNGDMCGLSCYNPKNTPQKLIINEFEE